MKEQGLRYNQGKLRYDLLQADALEGMVDILTFGAQKYTVNYINKWEKLFVASNANRMQITIVDQCVADVTKNNSGKITLNTLNDNVKIPEDGIEKIRIESEIWKLVDKLIQKKESEINEQSDLIHYVNTDLQNTYTSNYVKKVVKYVDQKDIFTLTITIPQENSEESYVVGATTASDSWETMWKVLKERSLILSSREHFKNNGDRNWEKGMAWSKVISSLKRHLAALEKGEDYDSESGRLHADHIQTNAHFLSAYYRIFPEGDDRPHKYLQRKKIGLDIDEVLSDCVGGIMERFPEITERSVYWSCPKFINAFKQVVNDDSFWAGLKPRIDPLSLPFEPHCYITSRPCSTEITKKWLADWGFPIAPVYTVGVDGSKVEVAKKSGIDIFVDDRYENFVELNNAGICTYLMTAPHNKRYNVGHKRIDSLSDLV